MCWAHRAIAPIRGVTFRGNTKRLGAAASLASQGIDGDYSHISNLYSFFLFLLHFREKLPTSQDALHSPEPCVRCAIALLALASVAVPRVTIQILQGQKRPSIRGVV